MHTKIWSLGLIWFALASFFGGCATAKECVQGAGTSILGDRATPPAKLENGLTLQYEANFACSGNYWFVIGFMPADGVELGVIGRRNRFFKLNKSGMREYLIPHEVAYRVVVSSLDDSSNELVEEDIQTIPPNEFAFGTVGLRIPKHFKKGERLLFSVYITADGAFFEDYQTIGGTISKAVY